jgi:Tol biopolymer transport system component
LTFGLADQAADCTPDGKFVVFQSWDPKAEMWVIWRLPTDGGAPTEIARGGAVGPVIAPDGKSLAYLKFEGQGSNSSTHFVIQPLGNAPSTDIPAPAGAGTIAWSPDGRGIAYVRTEGSSVNLYLLPLPGGKSIRLMHFDDEPSAITAYAWSRDGKKIAITRSRFNDSDVVLFNGLK